MKKAGLLTIGQSPRPDVTSEIEKILGDKIEILEKGALDTLNTEEINALSPDVNETVLISRLKDGSCVKLGENRIIPLMEKRIEELEEAGAELILLLCTGKFPDLKATVPLIYPQRLLLKVTPLFTRGECIATVNPDEAQCTHSEEKWKGIFKKVMSVSCNPYTYKGEESAKKAAEIIAASDAEAVILDCIGYTEKMKKDFERLTGKPVILPRFLAASIVSELI